jgi:phosphopentomutase
MKYLLITCAAWCAFSAHAEESASEHKKATIAQHQAIAAAHYAAARCISKGKDEKTCHAELAAACKGLALGKLCGMRHVH